MKECMQEKIKYHKYNSPIGTLYIGEDGSGICRLFLDESLDNAALSPEPTPLLKETAKQLDEYFSGIRKSFDIPFSWRGSEFQTKVWNAILDIPYGKTKSYKEIAEEIGNPNACRAVGMASNKNPVMIIVPCHRVIGSDGSLTGYACGTDIKRKLLELES